MKSIKQTYYINASIGEVWGALTNPDKINRWGGGPAKMSGELGFEFSLWGGDVYGKNIEVVHGSKLVQEWFGGVWDKPSIATFILSSKENETVINFTQTDVPDEEYKDIEQGWKDYYLGPIKDYLENKSG